MINLTPYSKEEPFTSYVKIINNKKDKTLVDELISMNSSIESQFLIHRHKSIENKLEEISPLPVSKDAKEKLKNLYVKDNKIISDVRKETTTILNQRILSECQYCTLGQISSMDHIMPKNTFPEFSINTQNLFPCCSECNSYKSDTWKTNDKRQFLNLYLDKLPKVKYLFVDIVYNEGVINAKFFLENRENLDDRTFELISNHYKNLKLLKRFAKASNEKITELQNILKSLSGDMFSKDYVKSFIRDYVERGTESFGYNYWKNPLYIALSEDDDFLNSCGKFK